MKANVIREKRKTISLTIKNEAIIVRAPIGMSDIAIEKFVQSKARWIDKQITRQRQTRELYQPYLSFQSFAFMGNALTLKMVESGRIHIEDDRFLCIPKKYAPPAGKHYIANWYRRTAKPILEERLIGIAQELGISFRSFALTNAKGKWGSCSGNNDIRLNWRLIYFDIAIIDYVIIHELCHTEFHNHAKEFWNLVARYYPEYKQAKHILQKKTIFMELYE